MTLSDCKKISIIVPSYNQGDYIGYTLNSILQQDYRPIEVIVIDNCSTDNTLATLEQYRNFEEITIISEPDSGQADAINKGFKLSTGEIVAWINSDDTYFRKDIFSKVEKLLTNNPDIDIVYGDAAIISKTNLLLRFFLVPDYNKDRMKRDNFISQPTVFFKKHVIKNNHLDSNFIGLDYDFWLNLGELGYTFCHIPEIIATDRQYNSRLSEVRKKEILDQINSKKLSLGYDLSHFRFLSFFDRLYQIKFRMIGLLKILEIIKNKNNVLDLICEEIRIDHAVMLALRQLFRNIRSFS